ncbi:MAG: hypothetical protein NC094_09675 [Bacteroidales bacterium]|nr:hypothetical protein [Lachnoclostridium sp.]MCM1384116.1 hypothetical protein [Lachnoclostridium sp.]MCM1465676.1 hypothetical protein [Bacteroidales bacterium]
MQSVKSVRNSGIEVKKIVAIVLIVISHVSARIDGENFYGKDVLSLSMATNNTQQFLVAYFRYFGTLGNYIFMACSAYVLVDSKKVDKSKIAVLEY